VISAFDIVPASLIDQPLPANVLRDGSSGYNPFGDSPQAMRDACGDAARDFKASYWIEAKDREAKARENDENKTWGVNYLDRFTNQGGGNGGYSTHECTTHMLRAQVEGARNRQRAINFAEGPKKDFRYEQSSKGSVWLSPLSVYAEANPGQWGGANCSQVLSIACRRGMLPDKIQPAEYKFKHTLHGTCGAGGKNQSRGAWVKLSDFPPGWQETAKLFQPIEVIVTTDWEEALCLLLHGCILGYGRSGHAVPPCMWNWSQSLAGYADSYDRFLWDSLGTFKSAVRSGVEAVVSVTAPDDWNDPAGTLAT
jgi:hypothetical protein